MHTDSAWHDLLGALRSQLPELVERFLATLGERAIYEAQLIPEADLRRTAEETLSMLIDRLMGIDTRADGADAAELLGKRRARQGVPLEHLIEAVRLDFRVIWGVLRELAGDEHAELLVEKVEGLLIVVEEYISDVQLAFVREIAILQRDSRLATERYLGQLFNADPLTDSLVEDIAAKLGVDPAAPFEVLAVPSSAVEKFHATFADWQSAHGVFSYRFREILLLFRVQEHLVSDWPKVFRGIPSIHFVSMQGLGLVAAAARATQELKPATAGISGLTSIRDLWAAGAAHYLERLLPGYFEQYIGRIHELPPGERERLTDTIVAYLATGSVKLTAARMGCHRNTVINRLKQFLELTALDVVVPEDAALALVLLRLPYRGEA